MAEEPKLGSEFPFDALEAALTVRGPVAVN